MKRKNMEAILLAAIVTCTSCEKYLAEKPAAALVVPATLADAQALLDNYGRINFDEAGTAEASTDNYYVTDADFLTLSEDQRRIYTWEKDRLFTPEFNDWSRLYQTVYYANTVLETAKKIQPGPSDTAGWNNVKGQALFVRAKSFLQAAWLWAPAFDEASADTDGGIVLRQTTDFNQPSVRATVRQTYRQILDDLKEAVRLLPMTPAHPMRASKPAAYGLLARTFLSMRQYDKAGLYADTALQLKNTLLDYNALNATVSFPFLPSNAEDIFHSAQSTPSLTFNPIAKIDSTLYSTYEANDLRKELFFKASGGNGWVFRGSYDGGLNLYSGLTTAELYLMRAEAAARAGSSTAALADINKLREKRYKTGTFVPYTMATAGDVLQLVLAERRKELVMRGLRWMDLKRLNREGAGIILQRVIGGQVYTLPPNDPRYALPIPEDVIETTGIPQNPR
jgi:starch-binding outer membrane protein, SusD/RagB family